jgi:hypothetical protein
MTELEQPVYGAPLVKPTFHDRLTLLNATRPTDGMKMGDVYRWMTDCIALQLDVLNVLVAVAQQVER